MKSTNLTGVSNTIVSTPWDDDVYDVEYGTPAKAYLYEKGDTEIVSRLGLVFLANYLGLIESSAEDLANLYKSIWPKMTLKKSPVFNNLTNRPVSTLTLGEIDITKYKFPGAATSMNLKSSRMTREHVKNFWMEMIKLADGDMTERSKMINLVSFIMINCLRLIKKESTCLDNHMPESGTHSFQSLYDGWLKLPIPPPGGNFSSRFQTSFPGNDTDSKRLFACLVNEWTSHTNDNDFIGLLKAGGMLALADNGLGLVSWTGKAAEKMGVEVGTYMTSILVTPSIIESMQRLLTFMTRSRPGITWPWCRLFTDSALFDLSTKKNKDATVLSALVVLGDPATMIQMSQFRDMEVFIKRYNPIALAVVNHYANTTSGTVGSEIARDIMNRKCRPACQ